MYIIYLENVNFLWRKDWEVFKNETSFILKIKQKNTHRWVAGGKELKMKKC